MVEVKKMVDGVYAEALATATEYEALNPVVDTVN